ncbi:MAG: DUF1592 domain-containing protein [Planctomycetota bacterium]
MNLHKLFNQLFTSLLSARKLWTLLALWTVGFPVLEPAEAADEKQKLSELRGRVLPLLEEHCLDCHSGAEPDAGLTLDHFDKPIDFLKGRDVWEHAAQKIKIEEMPPPEDSSLSDADRKYLVDWIMSTIDDYECGLEPNTGQVTLRRLNATEYRNTIRDLFAWRDYRPESAFAGDDVGYGFDNIGDVLTLPPLLMEKYFLEAERITQTLIKTPPRERPFERSVSGGQLQLSGKSNRGSSELTLASSGKDDVAILAEQIPWSGPFFLTVTAGGDQAGREPCVMEVYVDGRLKGKRAVPNDSGTPTDYQFRLPLKAGSRKIGIRFANDFYNAGPPKLDRNLVIHHVSLTGKKKSTGKLAASKLPASNKRIIFKTPSGAGDTESVTRRVIQSWASRAFRRPASKQDLDRLVELALSVQEDGDSFEESIQVALQAILISPKFLFRVEPPAAGLAFQKYRDLDEFELATRLAYFLWSSTPDSELLKLASAKKLREGNTLEWQIKRMIDDPRATQFVHNFAGQWLTLRKLRDFKPDPAEFPKWNDSIRNDAVMETKRFFLEVMRKNMSVLRLIDADFTYVNERLARYYGIRGVTGDSFRPVSLKGTQRAGLLTHASVLAVTSNPTRTSPVKRGKWILENLLDKPPPPAPAGVPELEEEKGQLTGTLRERLEQHRANPACANCHKLMDPLGFSLENFDAVGAYRTKDGIHQIDATGEMPDGTQVRGATELQKLLTERHRDDFVECLTEKMLTYALGRGLEYYDKCAVDKITDKLKQDNYRFSTLLVEIVRSEPFQKKGERDIGN